VVELKTGATPISQKQYFILARSRSEFKKLDKLLKYEDSFYLASPKSWD
jgi:hypothetical protein